MHGRLCGVPVCIPIKAVVMCGTCCDGSTGTIALIFRIRSVHLFSFNLNQRGLFYLSLFTVRLTITGNEGHYSTGTWKNPAGLLHYIFWIRRLFSEQHKLRILLTGGYRIIYYCPEQQTHFTQLRTISIYLNILLHALDIIIFL
jgi:hypothetical protein